MEHFFFLQEKAPFVQQMDSALLMSSHSIFFFILILQYVVLCPGHGMLLKSWAK